MAAYAWNGRKYVGKASESVDRKNEVKDGGERVHGSKRHKRREGKGGGERERGRAKRGRPDDELAEMTSRAKSLR